MCADVGLGHVDEDGGGAQGPRMCRAGSVSHLSLRLLRAQHELVLPGHLLQNTFLQHTTQRQPYQRRQVRFFGLCEKSWISNKKLVAHLSLE